MQLLEKIQRLEIRSCDRAKYKETGNKNKRMILNVFFGKVGVAAAYKHSLILMMNINPYPLKENKFYKFFVLSTLHLALLVI